jgi:hypothetical protein
VHCFLKENPAWNCLEFVFTRDNSNTSMGMVGALNMGIVLFFCGGGRQMPEP